MADIADRSQASEPEGSHPPGESELRATEEVGLDDQIPGLGGLPIETPEGVDPRLPRPARLRVNWREYSNPRQRDVEVHSASIWLVFARLCLWAWSAFRFLAGTSWDILLGRNTIRRRAQRLRQILQSRGATFIKIGQQLSMRSDLLPYEYTHELEKLLDSVPIFPFEQAEEAIERAIGTSIDKVFDVFDPKPIASASIACVYQGLLPNGDRVAIKVRRPNIGRQLAADLRGLSWVLGSLEAVWLPPGFSRHLLHELRQMLFEELDFVREARFTDLFRRSTADSELKFATSPQVHFDLSNHEVLVTEFVTGVFLTELMAVVEQHDDAALKALRSRGIHPELVAKRLIWINRFGGFEAMFFHADMHPGNVLVLPGSKIVLLDFGSCGAFTEKDRVVWRRVLYADHQGDISAFVQATLALLEPLPANVVHEFSKRAEAVFWDYMYASKSLHSEWWEKTSATLWFGFFRLAREFNIPIGLNTIRMIRGSLLTDTAALRLYPDLDIRREYFRYLRSAGRRAKKRLLGKISGTMFGDAEWTQWEQMFEAGWSALYRAQRFLDSTTVEYSKLRDRFNAFFANAFRAGATIVGVLLAATIVLAGAQVIQTGGTAPEPADLFMQVVRNGWFQVLALLVTLLNVRRWWYQISLN